MGRGSLGVRRLIAGCSQGSRKPFGFSWMALLEPESFPPHRKTNLLAELHPVPTAF